MSSPRTWGCFRNRVRQAPQGGVFPTHVGVFPAGTTSKTDSQCLPHARGGVSCRMASRPQNGWSSPRTWGCFWIPVSERMPDEVFPTHVGVFLDFCKTLLRKSRLPHARGGVSASLKPARRSSRSSPRTWGCFRQALHQKPTRSVFPTHVGVFPR